MKTNLLSRFLVSLSLVSSSMAFADGANGDMPVYLCMPQGVTSLAIIVTPTPDAKFDISLYQQDGDTSRDLGVVKAAIADVSPLAGLTSRFSAPGLCLTVDRTQKLPQSVMGMPAVAGVLTLGAKAKISDGKGGTLKFVKTPLVCGSTL